MLRRIRRRIKFNIFPLLLSVILLFTFSIHSSVFSPKPARALVGEALVPAIINAFTSAMGVSISYGNDSAANREYLTRSMVNDFRTFVSSLSQSVKDEYGYLTTDTPESYLARQTEIVQNNQDKWYIKLARGASAFLNLFGLSILTPLEQQLNSSSATNPIIYNSETGYYLADGTYVNIASSAAEVIQQFDMGVIYNTNNGYFIVDYNGVSGQYYSYIFTREVGGVLSSSTGSSVNTGYSTYGFWQNTVGYLVATTNRVNNNFVNISYNAGSGLNSAELLFGPQENNTIDIWKSGTMYVDGMDIPQDDTEDGYISVPDVVGLRSGMTDAEINDAIIDYSPSATNEGTDAYEYTKADAVPEDIPTNPDIPTYELPLIGINFPANWSLNLHGIWYYVRQWVASIASFVGWLFGVYSNLPYAMVVPIYATAVIVIVLGIYKRFFM